MSRDFLSTQIKTGKIIGSNSNESQPKLIVYSDEFAEDKVGGFKTALSNRIASIGTETFIYIDGVPGSKKANTPNSVTVFGGDVVIKGDLYAEGNASSMWEVDPTDANNLIPTNIIDGDTGLFAMDFGKLKFNEYNSTLDVIASAEDFSRYTLSSRDCGLDKFFEVDTTFSGYDHIVPKA